MIRASLVVLVLMLAGCVAPISLVAHDKPTQVGSFTLTPPRGWNLLPSRPGSAEHLSVLTREGIPLDRLELYSAVPAGKALILPLPGQTGQGIPVFRADMRADDVADMFKAIMTRDGSTIVVNRLAPSKLGAAEAIRMDYTLQRKSDNVKLSGFVVAATLQSKLYAVNFRAPTLVFFPKIAPEVEAMIQTASLQ